MLDSKTPAVLVVDDVDMNRMILEEILQDEYTILTEKKKKKALEIVKSQYPMIILLDVLMPEMGGYEAISVLKASATIRP
jgi:putative two-component system response regulator